ncbi:MAG: ribonuclease HI [Planctomycetota bacterium]|nr:MAG: ribonuclease HI [Planctomycetota bacterium]
MIKIYTDGGCRGNPGIGGWAACIYLPNNEKHIIAQGTQQTTNNIMELTGAIKGIQYYQKHLKIEGQPIGVYTDSMYVINCVTTWIINWKKNNWRNAAKKPVKNVELIKELDELVQEFKVSMNWVKGHSGDEGNETCDETLNIIMDRITNGEDDPCIIDPEL